MRLRIESDGTPHGTRVVNADTGEVLEQVVEATWSIAPNRLPVVSVVLAPKTKDERIAVCLTGEAEIRWRKVE